MPRFSLLLAPLALLLAASPEAQTLQRDDAASALVADVYGGSVAWGDYTGDGRPDLVVTGRDASGAYVGEVYRATASGGLERDDAASALVADVFGGSVAWGDYTGDGRADLVVTGLDVSCARVGEVYRSTASGGLERDDDASALVPDLMFGVSVAWEDYTGDGRADLVVTGFGVSGAYVGEVYRATASGGLERDDDASALVADVFFGSVAWGTTPATAAPTSSSPGKTSAAHVGEVYRSTASGGLERDAAASALVADVFR